MEYSYLAGIVGVPLAIAGILALIKTLKTRSMMRAKKQWLTELADSWTESSVVEFNPADVVTEEIFQDMIGDNLLSLH